MPRCKLWILTLRNTSDATEGTPAPFPNRAESTSNPEAPAHPALLAGQMEKYAEYPGKVFPALKTHAMVSFIILESNSLVSTPAAPRPICLAEFPHSNQV